MSFLLKESVGFVAIAAANGYFVYPYLKALYSSYHTVNLEKGDPTHYAFMDLSIDGKDIGRLDFELFGHSSPKTVNTFLGFVSGDFDPFMRYKGTYFTRIL